MPAEHLLTYCYQGLMPTILIPFGVDPSAMSPIEIYCNSVVAWHFAQGVERLGGTPLVLPLVRADSLVEHARGVSGVVNLCDGDPGLPWGMHEATQVFERLGVPFTGERSRVFAANADKERTRQTLASAGVRVPGASGLPLFAKPRHLHGSFHISRANIIRTLGDLERFKQGPVEYYYESYLEGPEYTVTIWEGQVIGVSQVQFAPGCEVLTRGRKWEPSSPDANHPPSAQWRKDNLGPVDEIAELGVAAARAIGGGAMMRVDVRMSRGEPYVIDLNPNPYLGPDGFYAKAFEANGVSYARFVDTLIQSLISAVRPPADLRPGLALRIQPKQGHTWCGPACLQAIATYYGQSYTQGEIAHDLPPSEEGYDPEQLTRTAVHLGFRALYLVAASEETLERLLQQGIPPLVSYRTALGGHYGVLTKMTAEHVYLQDPDTGGEIRMRRAEFHAAWYENYGQRTSLREIVVIARADLPFPQLN